MSLLLEILRFLLQSARREPSGATTASACRLTSSATRWCPAEMEATSQGAPVAHGTEEESPRGIAHSDATTEDVVRMLSLAAAATAAATAPMKSDALFAVSIHSTLSLSPPLLFHISIFRERFLRAAIMFVEGNPIPEATISSRVNGGAIGSPREK